MLVLFRTCADDETVPAGSWAELLMMPVGSCAELL